MYDVGVRNEATEAGTGQRVGAVRTFGVLLLCTYAPYLWLITTSYPWDSYRWTWIKLWPVLPGLLPSVLLQPFASSLVATGVRGAVTAAFLLLAFRCGVRSRRALLATSAIVLLLSLLNSWGAYHAFRA